MAKITELYFTDRTRFRQDDTPPIRNKTALKQKNKQLKEKTLPARHIRQLSVAAFLDFDFFNVHGRFGMHNFFGGSPNLGTRGRMVRGSSSLLMQYM